LDVERWTGRDELCHALEAPCGTASDHSTVIHLSAARSCGRLTIGRS
jgi:hypothetical protein